MAGTRVAPRFHNAYSSEKAKRDIPEFRCTIDFPDGARQTLEDLRRRSASGQLLDDDLPEPRVDRERIERVLDDARAPSRTGLSRESTRASRGTILVVSAEETSQW